MDLFKTGLKNTFKLTIAMILVYWFVVDPIVNDWEDTVIYKTFFYKPVKSDTDELSCNGSNLSDIACKGVKGANNFLDRVKEKIEESKAERRADPNNQFENLEECLASDKEYDLNMSRAEYCESDYVLLKN